MDDFLMKFTGLRVVIDAGAPQERTFSLRADQVLATVPTPPWLPEGTPLAGMLATLSPLPAGPHTVQFGVVMAAEHWNGRGTEVSHYLPTGETIFFTDSFEVVHRGSE